MNKKLMAVAVAGAFGAIAAPVALAQSSTVTLSGNLNFIYGMYNAGGPGLTQAGANNAVGVGAGATKLKGDSMNDSESELVLDGVENLGGGMSAWFKCSSSLDVLGNRASQQTSGLCGRNSAIGLKGNFGNVNIGNWDTPAKVAMNNFRVFALSYPMGIGMLFNGASSDVSNQTVTTTSTQSQFVAVGGGASMSRRQQRLLTYITPEWKGLVGSVGYSAANEWTQNSIGSTIQKPRLYSAGVTYTNGPLQLGFGYEQHKDYNPGGGTLGTAAVAPAGNNQYVGGTDRSYQLAAGYSFLNNTVRVNAIYVHLEYQVSGGFDLTQNNWGVNGQWNIAGPHLVRLGYTVAGSTGGSAGSAQQGAGPFSVGAVTANGGAGNTGAKKYSFEYGYTLSKRTELGFGYAKVNNDLQSNQNIGTGSTAANYGESQSYYGLRLTHKF